MTNLVEASVFDVLQAELTRNFEPEVCEKMGQDIGFRFATRFRFGPPPFGAPLDVLKFLCKEVWIELYGKKADRLQTNHKGTFMCTDVDYPPLSKMNNATSSTANRMVALHKGIVRGALTNMGVNVTEVLVQILGTEDSSTPLGCCFTIKTSV